MAHPDALEVKGIAGKPFGTGNTPSRAVPAKPIER